MARLCAAYWECFVSPGDKSGNKPGGNLERELSRTIELPVQVMERAGNYPPLHRKERAMAAVAARSSYFNILEDIVSKFSNGV